MTKKEINNIVRRLYYLLNKGTTKIDLQKFPRIYVGEYKYDEDKITIDPRKEIISIFIHEALHKWHPDWSETKVLKMESKIVNQLSKRQFVNILKRLVDKL